MVNAGSGAILCQTKHAAAMGLNLAQQVRAAKSILSEVAKPRILLEKNARKRWDEDKNQHVDNMLVRTAHCDKPTPEHRPCLHADMRPVANGQPKICAKQDNIDAYRSAQILGRDSRCK